jgi:predicted nucleic acid-binding protein
MLLDTTVLIDHLRGVSAARAFLAELPALPSCSEMSRVEVLQGLRPRERAAAEGLFAVLRWIPVDEPIARRAGELGRRYRSSHPGLSLADLVIGATALQLDLALATSNVRHYPMLRSLRPPY